MNFSGDMVVRQYEWKKYKELIINPLLLKCRESELKKEARHLIDHIDRSYRLYAYIRMPTIRSSDFDDKNFVFSKTYITYLRKDSDKEWLRNSILVSIKKLEDVLILLRLSS